MTKGAKQDPKSKSRKIGRRNIDPESALSWEEIELMRRHESILRPKTTVLLLIDLQEKLMKVMKKRFQLLKQVRTLSAAAKLLDIPIIVTEQYPKGLGPTDSRLKDSLTSAFFFEKNSFSIVGSAAVMEALKKFNRPQILVSGIETHICVSQSCLDLLAHNFQVTVAVDAVSSRHAEDKEIALARLRQSGVTVTTTEAALFELLERSNTAVFKLILKLIK